jgi:glycosyltransferase involved in cell wall biosynthesis
MTMRILFVHQNFPGQFRHAARALAAAGHEVVALGIHTRDMPGIRSLRYRVTPPPRPSALEPAREFETMVARGLACAQAMQQLREQGFEPDVVVAHPGWGEALFCKDVWPAARLLVFAEFYYGGQGSDFGFDAEFHKPGLQAQQRLRLKNTALLHALVAADGGYAPTRWQHAQIPAPLRSRFDVIFDGIDTHAAAPDDEAWVSLRREGVRLRAGDEVLTFVNRNLEPYRGFHVFMRALPAILQARPHAHCLIVGGDGVSYGMPPEGGGTWRQRLLQELAPALPMDRVHFLGILPYRDYLRVLQVSACHVYLTYPFVLSWSCVEALSAGCVVVGSRTPPVQEFIEHGQNGWLVDFFDREALVSQVVEVLANPGAQKALRQRARSGVVEQYDLQGRCLQPLVELILGQRSARSPVMAPG